MITRISNFGVQLGFISLLKSVVNFTRQCLHAVVVNNTIKFILGNLALFSEFSRGNHFETQANLAKDRHRCHLQFMRARFWRSNLAKVGRRESIGRRHRRRRSRVRVVRVNVGEKGGEDG